jgi:hypothetical protein
MDLVFNTPEFSHTGNKLLEMVLKFLNFGLLKPFVVVKHLIWGVSH